MMSESAGSTTLRSLLREGGLATLRSTVLFGIALAELVMFVVVVLAASLIGVGIGLVLLPGAVAMVQYLTNLVRRYAREWSGVEIAVPYAPEPAGPRSPVRRCHHLLGDRANWRDTLWMLVDGCVGIVLMILPLVLVLYGLRGMAMPFLTGSDVLDWTGDWYIAVPVTDQTAWVAAIFGLALLPLTLWAAPRLLLLHARMAEVLLSPTEVSRLTHRVQHLSETRDDAVGSQASELRRIERNLHDGAQARLVAMGMTLDAAMRMMNEHPEAARSLMDEAKSSSAKALEELRNLVRGIQPPVLVDRGIADAVRTLAMENALRIETAIDLPGRPSPAVEAAAYFSVSEVLNNAMKHSDAETGAIDMRYAGGCLVINVSDNGQGGADPTGGTGLRGIERRLAALDGYITVLSPTGGPTMVTIEIPCRIESN